jgi:hypothetical protein
VDKEREDLIKDFTTKLREQCEREIEGLNDAISPILEDFTTSNTEELQSLFNKRQCYLSVIEEFAENQLHYSMLVGKERPDGTRPFAISNKTLDKLIKRKISTARQLASSFYLTSKYFHASNIEYDLINIIGEIQMNREGKE